MDAAIDVGTNAVKCCVARHGDGDFEVVREIRAVTRLGAGLAEDGRLAPTALRKTCDAVVSMVETARSLGASDIRIVGTSAAREASNTEELAECIHARCGARLEVLSGDEEARLMFLAVHSLEADASGRVAVIDIGGGSTELAVGTTGDPNWLATVPVGAVRLTSEALGGDPPDADQIRDSRERIGHMMPPLARLSGARLFATGGTVRAMASVHASHAATPWETARRLSLSEVRRQVAVYAGTAVEDRRAIPGMERERADIILAGSLILEAYMERAGAGSVTVTDWGVRHGVILDAA